MAAKRAGLVAGDSPSASPPRGAPRQKIHDDFPMTTCRRNESPSCELDSAHHRSASSGGNVCAAARAFGSAAVLVA